MKEDNNAQCSILNSPLIPPGYKQTEVGVIPEDWEVAHINTVTSSIFLGLTSRVDYVDRGGVPLVRATDIAGGRLSFDNARGISVTQHKKLTQYRQARRGDVLVSKSGSLGVCALVDTDLDFSIYESIIVLQPRSRLHSGFLLSLLRAEATQSRMIGGKVGSTVSHLNSGMFRDLVIPLPPTKAEQEAIAGALSDADALIESLEQLLTKKRHLKQGAMKELLTGKKRLPGFSGEWEVKTLDELADIRSGGTPSTTQPQFWDGDVLWCTPTDITALNGFKYLNSTSRTISEQGLKASSAELIPVNSIAMTSRATIGECAINQVPIATNQGFKNFVPSDTVDVEFLYYLLLKQKQGFIRLCGGSTFLEIGKGLLSAYEVRLPATKHEQTAIAIILSDMDAEIAALETKLTKTRQLKQGMMQELLTGRIRLV